MEALDVLGMLAAAGLSLAGLGLVLRMRSHGIVRRRVRAGNAAGPGPAGNGPLRILCLGDSLTDSSWPSHLEAHLRSLGADVEVQGLGFPGATSVELLSAIGGVDLGRLAPDLTLLLVGTNDSRVDLNHVETPRFVDALEQLAARLLERRGPGGGPYLAICTVPPVVPVPFHFSEDSALRVHEEINPALRRTGRKLRVPLVELEAGFDPRWLRPGDVHPTEEGYREMAGLAALQLGPWLLLLGPPLGQREPAR